MEVSVTPPVVFFNASSWQTSAGRIWSGLAGRSEIGRVRPDAVYHRNARSHGQASWLAGCGMCR